MGEHFRIWGKRDFKIFTFFILHLNNNYLREKYEKYFREKFTPALHY